MFDFPNFVEKLKKKTKTPYFHILKLIIPINFYKKLR